MRQEKQRLKKLCSFFAEASPRFGLVLVYLFGSQVGGHLGPLSDYDFGILFSRKPANKKKYLLAHLLGEVLGTGQVDLVALNQAPIELQYHIIATGHLLYESSPGARVEFEAQTLSIYFDYLPMLRSQRREILAEKEGDHEAGIQRYRKALAKTQRVLAQARTIKRQKEARVP